MGCVGCIECGSGLGKGGLVVPFLAMRRVWYKKWCAGENVWRSGGGEISSPFGPFFPVCALFPNTPLASKPTSIPPLLSRYLCCFLPSNSYPVCQLLHNVLSLLFLSSCATCLPPETSPRATTTQQIPLPFGTPHCYLVPIAAPIAFPAVPLSLCYPPVNLSFSRW